MPLVFLTAIYSLYHVARLRKGQVSPLCRFPSAVRLSLRTSSRSIQSVLIHSAAGGVGLACVQLAQLVGAEVRTLAACMSPRWGGRC